MPGDPNGISQLVGILRSYDSECQSLQGKLNGFDITSWVGSAGDEFRQRFAAFTPKLEAVSTRLGETATALDNFASQLTAIQAQAMSARNLAGSVMSEIQAVTPLADEQRKFLEQQELATLIGKPPKRWNGPNYILRQRELQNQYWSQQKIFDGCVAEYNAIVTYTSTRLSQVSKDSLANTLLSEIEHYGADVARAVATSEQALNEAISATIDYVKGHMTQILDYLSMAVAILAIVTTGGVALGIIAAVIGVAQIGNSVISHEVYGNGSTSDMYLGIASGVLSSLSGGLVGAATRAAKGSIEVGAAAEGETSSATNLFKNGVMDWINPPSFEGTTEIKLLTGFSERLYSFYTPTLKVINFAAGGVSIFQDVVLPKLNFIYPWDNP